jgi:hypothetical protein
MFKNNNLMLCVALFFCALIACKNEPKAIEKAVKATTQTDSFPPQQFYALHSKRPILIDADGSDSVWMRSEWHQMRQVWLGNDPEPEDFTGRYKMAWDENYLYILAEITDDTLVDTHKDGLVKYWDDDCLEIFVDENASGGNHQYNYNAFAYHLSLDNKIVDIGTDSLPHYFNEHARMKRKTKDNVSIWEVAVKIYPDTFDPKKANTAVKLVGGKTLGFALAYCDNDRSAERENFIGSVVVRGAGKNQGWINASIFGRLLLSDSIPRPQVSDKGSE